jgi:hypothetical protein
VRWVWGLPCTAFVGSHHVPMLDTWRGAVTCTGLPSAGWPLSCRSTYTRANGETRSLATTQFEAAAARLAFPCFDEPAFKVGGRPELPGGCRAAAQRQHFLILVLLPCRPSSARRSSPLPRCKCSPTCRRLQCTRCVRVGSIGGRCTELYTTQPPHVRAGCARSPAAVAICQLLSSSAVLLSGGRCAACPQRGGPHAHLALPAHSPNEHIPGCAACPAAADEPQASPPALAKCGSKPMSWYAAWPCCLQSASLLASSPAPAGRWRRARAVPSTSACGARQTGACPAAS